MYKTIVMQARAREREKINARILALLKESRGKGYDYLFGRMVGLNVSERPSGLDVSERKCEKRELTLS